MLLDTVRLFDYWLFMIVLFFLSGFQCTYVGNAFERCILSSLKRYDTGFVNAKVWIEVLSSILVRHHYEAILRFEGTCLP